MTYYYNVRIERRRDGSAFDTEVSTLLPRVLPAAISDLSALSGNTDGSINLSWTAPREDGAVGGAVLSYIVKYSAAAFDDTTWDAATTAASPPAPVAPGLKQTMTINSLTPGQLYYFRVKSLDGGNNLSPIDSASPQPQAKAKVSENLPKPPIYIAFLTTCISRFISPTRMWCRQMIQGGTVSV